MKNVFLAIGLAAALAGCSRSDALEIPKGSEVTVHKKDGVQVAGRLVEVRASQVVLEARDGSRMQVPRNDIKDVTVSAEASAAARKADPVPTTGAADTAATPERERGSNPPSSKVLDRAPEYKEVTIPSGTVLSVELQTGVGSDTSQVEDQVRGTVRRTVTIDGVRAIPAGAVVIGHITSVERPGKVKGRGAISFRFNQVDLPGDGERLAIRTATVSRLAPATKKQDAAKIGGGAAGGAIIGGILGGGDGAAKGAAIGGGAGTAVVLSTRGKDVKVPPGTLVSVRLTSPLTVRVAIK